MSRRELQQLAADTGAALALLVAAAAGGVLVAVAGAAIGLALR